MAMTHRATARVVGTLFLTATVPFSLAVVLLDPILGAPDYLAQVSNNQARVGLGAFLELLNHISVVGIAVVMYPVLRPFSERLSVGYVAARSIEAVLFAMGTANLLALVNLSQNFAAAGAPPGSHFHTLGDMLLVAHDLDRAALAFIAFGVGALVLNYGLLRTRLVPRWLSVFGLFGAASILAARLALLSGFELSAAAVMTMDTPIMLQEMVLAVWLIMKGFHTGVATEGKEVAL